MANTDHIKNSPLFCDLIEDIEELYFDNKHNFEMKFVEINENYGSKNSLGVIFYEANDKSAVIKELKNFNSFKDNTSSWEINAYDWDASSTLWVQGWGVIKFKMKVQESEVYCRRNKSSNRKSPDLKVDVAVAPDLGLTLWGSTEDFQKKAAMVAAGLSRVCFFGLNNWDAKEASVDYGNHGSSSQCECGAHKTYGKDVNPYFHSRWCKLFVNNK